MCGGCRTRAIASTETPSFVLCRRDTHSLIRCLLSDRIWTEEPLAVEVNEVIGSGRDSNLSLPRNVGEKCSHRLARRKGGDINQACFRVRKERFEFLSPFAVHWAGTGHGFDEHEPVSLCVVDVAALSNGGSISNMISELHLDPVRPDESITVEVNQMVWRFGNPDLGFPCDIRCEFSELRFGQKPCDENDACLASFRETTEFQMTDRRNRAGTVDRFD